MKNSKDGDITSPNNQKINVTDKFILQALRSTGYSVYTAIPELIDNSIDAESTKIEIIYDSSERTLLIKDNGNGMSFDKMKESMDIGCERIYDDTEIGYFGVGLNSACLNLIDVEIPDNFIEIITSNGIETTRVEWTPMVDPLSYKIFREDLCLERGTTIKIIGVIKFQESSLKKQLGVFYYPILNCNNLSISVNDNIIVPNDPLYRNSILTKQNSFYAMVKDQVIKIDAVALDENEPKHSWDESTGREGKGKKGFSVGKSGSYVVYGGRYVEYGGTLGYKSEHASDTRTRYEFTIPKDLTSNFTVKFNKTKGINISEIDCMDDLRLKLRDIYRWASELRKGVSEISDDEKKKLDEMSKRINESAKKTGFKRAKREISETNHDKHERVSPPEKPQLIPRIRINKIFDFKYEALDNISVFWKFNWLNGVFVITINEGHLFYKEIFSTMENEKKEQLLRFLASLAYAQYESLKKDDISETNIELFWEQYWSDVSTRLRYLLEY